MRGNGKRPYFISVKNDVYIQKNSQLIPAYTKSISLFTIDSRNYTTKVTYLHSPWESYFPYPKPYPKTESWKESTDCCSWDGITCDLETGNVIGLHLSNSLLFGTIYSNNPLFFLLHLQSLDLSYNDFNNSHLSPQFGQFFNLTYLNLSSSNFGGEFPSEISYLSGLVSLDLSLNDFLILETTIFNKLAQNLTQLQELDLSFVNMSLVAPSSLMNLSSSLTYLKLRYCGLHGKIPDISHLSKLVTLHLSFVYSYGRSMIEIKPMTFDRLVRNLTKIRDFRLRGVNMSMVAPSSLMNLSSSLSSLALILCELQGKFPDNIIQRPNLQLLYLTDNEHLTGSLPRHNWTNSLRYLVLSWTKIPVYLDYDFIGNLKSLETLGLSGCNFRVSNLELLGELTQLTQLSLSDNNFTGQISSSFGSLKQLSSLVLSYNNFNGQIPNYFTNFTQLSFLSLSNNRFTGPIPVQLGRLSCLDYLDLSNNKLHGPIPNSIFKLVDLTVLILSSNNLTGEASPATCKLKSLQILDLSNNSLNGFIPQCLGNFSNNLSVLHLGMNKFHGTIPETFSVGSSLRYLNFNGNQLQRKIPLSISNCRNLEILDLGNNNIDDSFPHFLGTLSKLQILILKSNKLHGLVKGPTANYSFSKLRIFDLSRNKLHGPIPNSIFKLVDLTVLILSSNNLTGEASSAACKLKSLQILDLSNNSLNGFIPQCLGNFSKSLSVLHLGMNKFHGTIPETFSVGSSLRYLNFNGNQLQRKIPLSISNCRNLEILDLGNNNIDDSFPHFLGTLSKLQILILKSNKLHGLVKGPTANYSFSKLRIFDLSRNMFSGPLPAEYFDNFKAMVNSDVKMEYMRDPNNSYDYSEKSHS
ncbi:receptor-like protein Cf-9 [Hevea brasiliensis]|uniref:receptor-like protein Cf-9 n=1 Tax=Hevea brasiliensis TaxID=3981 RepID=UPI0025FFDBDB|nr:receptor-like protein Cf-9 [Hevea brasiliensis]